MESSLKPEPRRGAGRSLPALLLLCTAPLPALAEATASWTPDDIRVSRAAPGETPSVTAHFEVAPDGDARIDMERRDGTRRTAGTILLIGDTKGHLGQSLYLREIEKAESGAAPPVDLAAERRNGEFVATMNGPDRTS